MKFSNAQLLKNANEFLETNFPGKHNKPITLADVKNRLKTKMFRVTKASAKAHKSNKKHTKYINVIFYLVSADYLGPKLCVNYDKCKSGCLLWSGHGGTYSTMRGRTVKTLCHLIYPEEFKARIAKDVVLAKRTANKLNKKLALRLNGTTDLNPKIFGINADEEIIRYEYTKCLAYALKPSNKHIHYSYSFYGNVEEAQQALKNGINVVMVTKNKDCLPEWTEGYNKINGDEHDLRFLDKKGSIVYLEEKKGGFSQSHRRTKLTV